MEYLIQLDDSSLHLVIFSQFNKPCGIDEMTTKIIIGIVLGFVLGFFAHEFFPRKSDTTRHWLAVEKYNAYMRDPSNYKPDINTGFSMATLSYDPEPHLAALVEAGELRHLDIVLPTVTKSREATRFWMAFCANHTNDIVFSTANPGYVAFKTLGVQPMHFNVWYKEAGEAVVQQLIAELQQMKPENDAIAEISAAKTEENRFYALNAAAKESMNSGKFEDARRYAEELQKLLPKYPRNWNYGNAVQDVHIVLGRLALREGKVDEAKDHLLEAGKSPGSPQMNSFGPNMSLAKDLIEKGERIIVLHYFDLCAKFWEMDRGQLAIWKTQVEKGEMPDFGPNLLY